MSRPTRDEYLERMRCRYRRHTGKPAKGCLLDEFCLLTGHERKYASKLLSGRRGPSAGADAAPSRGGRPPTYGEEVAAVIHGIWRCSEQPCGKRLKPMLGTWLPFYERRHGALPAEVREGVLSISAAQIDRVLAPRKVGAGTVNRRTPKAGAAVKALVPVRAGRWDPSGADMGKKRQRYQKPAGPLRRLNGADPSPQASMGSFPGTDWSLARGFVYFPELDSEREVDSWSRTGLMRRTRAMHNGIGFVRGTITCIARMVCGTGLMPQPLTGNPGLDDRIARRFRERTGSRNTFHLAKKYSFPSSQRAVVRGWMKDGDVLGVLARTDTGSLRVGLYEGNQIGTGAAGGRGWVDGVLLDQHRAPLAYRILSSRDGRQTHVDVPTDHAFLIGDYERIGQVRGLGCLYHAVSRLLDRGEILAATTKGIKLSQQIGYAIESELPSTGPAGGPGSLSPRPKVAVETPGGKITLEKFLASGQVEELAAGKKFRILHDERPHPNIAAHLDGLIRDVALGAGFFPEVFYNAVGLSGAATRFVMAGTQNRIEELQETLVETYCAPVYIAHVADMIRLGEIEHHPNWWRHTWLTPARMTVDFGKDGKLHIEQYKQGMITLRTLYGYRGEDWKAEVTDYLNEREFMKKEAARRHLTMEEAFPQFYGTNVGSQSSTRGEDEDPDDEDDDTDPDDE